MKIDLLFKTCSRMAKKRRGAFLLQQYFFSNFFSTLPRVLEIVFSLFKVGKRELVTKCWFVRLEENHEKEIASLHYSKLNTAIGHGAPFTFPCRRVEPESSLFRKSKFGVRSNFGCLEGGVRGGTEGGQKRQTAQHHVLT